MQRNQRTGNPRIITKHDPRTYSIRSRVYIRCILGVALTVNRCYKPQAPLIGLLLTLSGHEFDTTPHAAVQAGQHCATLNDHVRALASDYAKMGRNI